MSFNINELTKSSGEWLNGQGPMSDIVISSRIRLARNLAAYPFLTRADSAQRQEILDIVIGAIKNLKLKSEIFFFDVDKANDLDRQVLVERHLISRQHAEGNGCRGLAVSPPETVAMMVNEEDHLRIQVLRSGFQLNEAWEEINEIDDQLAAELEFAFHPRYGYLTACPTNLGTGIRVSVMLHLPALKLTGEIEKVFQAGKDLKLAVRGLYGEHTEAAGDFYQISNQTTLGRTELDYIDDFKNEIIPKIVDYEKRARKHLTEKKSVALDDAIYRAYGLLGNARTMSSQETMLLLSHLRMGVHLGYLNDIDLKVINELFIKTQPAHLQKIEGRILDGEERSILRAELIRRRLTGDGGPSSN